jgi:outer membrane protein assembly factor BamB
MKMDRNLTNPDAGQASEGSIMTKSSRHLLSLTLLAAAVGLLAAGCPKPPRIPEKPTGGALVPKNASRSYSTVTTDPDGLPVAYQFDWGDVSSSAWSAFAPGDSRVSDTHTYTRGGTMLVRARAKNTRNGVSNWSETLHVSVIAGESSLKWVYGFPDPEDPEDTLSVIGTLASTADGSTICVIGDLGYLHFLGPDGYRKSQPYQVLDFEMVNSPSIGADGRIFVGSDVPRFYSIQPTRVLAWEHMVSSDAEGIAAIDADGNAYFVAADSLHAVNATGLDKWPPRHTGGGPGSPGITADGHLVIVGGDDSLVHAILIDVGDTAWTVRTGAAVSSSPAITGDGMIYIGSDDGALRKMKQEGGGPLWQYAANSPIRTSPVIGPDGTVYFTAEDGVLHAVKPDGQASWTLPLGCTYPSTAALSASDILYLVATFPTGTDSLIAINTGTHDRRWGVSIPDVGGLEVSPLIDKDGQVYVTAGSHVLCFWGLGGPAQSDWPMLMHDPSRTGRAGQ